MCYARGRFVVEESINTFMLLIERAFTMCTKGGWAGHSTVYVDAQCLRLLCACRGVRVMNSSEIAVVLFYATHHHANAK